MKPVSKVSKEGNKFKWIPFSEQISKVNSGAVSAKLKFSDANLDQETYFFAAVLEYNEKDYGDDYHAFLDDIPYDELASYAQLLHYKDVIFEALNYHLSVEGSKAYPTLLGISIAFIKDLKDDFFPYLWTFFDTVIVLVGKSSENIEVMEAAFAVLANIFQMHWRSIVTTLRKTFIRFAPLFGHSSKFIRRFASEGFAYLLRKSSAISKLCQFLYKQVTEDDNKHVKDGVISLLFNGIKGVHKKFQSRTGELLTNYIQSALDLEDDDEKAMANYILVNVMQLCCEWTTSKDSKDVFDVLLKLTKLQLDNSSVKNINFMCDLISVWVTEKNGKLMVQETELFELFKLIVSDSKLSQLNLSFLNLVSNALNNYSEKYTDPNAIRQLIYGASKNILLETNRNSIEAAFNFFQSLLDLNVFDIWCIGSVADIVQHILELENLNDEFSKPILKFFSTYVLKRRPFLEEKPNGRKIFFDASKLSGLRKLVVNRIKNLDEEFDNLAIYSLVVYPWLWRSSDKIEALDKIKSLLQKLVIKESPTYQDSLMVYLAVYDICLLESNYLTKIPNNVFTFLKNYNIMDEVVLRTSYILISSLTELSDCDLLQELEKLVLILEPALLCPSGVVRRWVLKNFLLFDSKLAHGEEIDGKFVASQSAFEILLNAEQTPLDLQCYRQRGNYFRMIPHRFLNKMLPKGCSTNMKKIPLALMFAQFFENFTLIWPQINEIIAQYAKASDFQYFWEVYQNALDLSKISMNSNDGEGNNLEVFDFVSRPCANYSTFRIQLFKMLLNFPEIARKAGDFFADTFFDIYENEFCPVYLMHDRKIDLLKEKELEDVEAETETVEEEKENDTKGQELVIKDSVQDATTSTKSSSMSVLKILLEVFTKFKNPKTLKKEADLRNVYEKLLSSTFPDLQQAAFQCILTYHYPFLNPYSDCFNDLFDKKRFADGLARFNIDESNTTIKEEHRPALMPYLIKILNGKLMMKGGDTKMRTKKIMIYLAGLKSSEMDLFLDEVFGSFVDFVKMNRNLNEQTPNQLYESISKNYDPTKTLPPRKLKSILMRLNEVFKRLTSELGIDQFRFLLRILISVGCLIINALKIGEKLEKFNITRFKSARVDYFGTLTTMFDNLGQLQMIKADMDCLWEYGLEPFIEKLTPEAMITMICSWSKNPSIYPLYLKPFSEKTGKFSPLSLMFKYLKDCKNHTRNDILNSISRLLSLSDEPTNMECLPESKLEIREGATLGIEILLQNLPQLIDFLVENIPTDPRKARSLPEVYLEILCQLSPYVEDIDAGKHFASTLLTYVLQGKIRSENKLMSILHTLAELSNCLDDPKVFLKRIAKLFTTFKQRGPRTKLLKVIQILIKHKKLVNDKNLVKYLEILNDLESYDKNHLEDPDYDRRHEAHTKLQRIFDAGNEKMDSITVIFLLRSHVNSVITLTDIAVRGTAVSAFHSLILYVAKIFVDEPSIRQELLKQHLIPLIREGLLDNKDITREAFVKALDLLVNHFADDEPLFLGSLKQLKHENIELDFFANMCHIQQHRRVRALKNLGDKLVDGTIKLPYGCLSKFILPLIKSYFIVVEQKLFGLSIASLKIFTEMMKLANWKTYQRTLQTYISKLDSVSETIAVVKALNAVIDGFHFDLSSCVDKKAEFFAAANPRRNKRRLGTAIYRREEEQESTEVQNEQDDEEKNDESEEEIEIAVKKISENPEVILEAITSAIIPHLRKSLRTNANEFGHKYSQHGRSDNDSEELKRAPIALVAIKLLLKLPTFVLDQNLQGVISSVLRLLGSKIEKIRETARSNLQKIVQLLGVKYLPFIINELRGTLNQGYKIYVMIFTVQQLIVLMEPLLKTGDLDACAETIISICNQEQFDDRSQEKDTRITITEEKFNKTNQVYRNLGKFLSCGMLMKVITPLKENIDVKPNSLTISKVGNLLKSFASGLSSNAGINQPDLLEFAYFILQTYLKDMLDQTGVDQSSTNGNEQKKVGLRPESCYLLPANPTRMGVITKTSIKSKVAVFVEFSMKLLPEVLLKKLFRLDPEFAMKSLAPLVPSFLQCLKLKHEKIIGATLKCMNTVLKRKLPLTEEEQKEFIERLFVILADYSGTDKAPELREYAFNCMTELIESHPELILTKENLLILLNYSEADMIVNDKHVAAFALIKALLNKKIQDERIPQLIDDLKKLSVRSGLDNIRKKAREMVIIYIKNYTLDEEKLGYWVKFYLQQLEYEEDQGRLSTMEMLNSIFDAMHGEICNTYALFIFIKLSARLLNDDNPQCVKYVCLLLQKLFQSTTDKPYNDFFSITKDWILAEKEKTNFIGYRVLFELIKGLPGFFVSRLPEFMNIIFKILCEIKEEDIPQNTFAALIDSLTQSCQSLPDAFVNCLVSNSFAVDFLTKMNFLLKFKWSNIRASSSAFFGQVLAIISAKTVEKRQILIDLIVKSIGWLGISFSLCFIIKNRKINESMIDQAIRNLIAISSLIESEEEFSKFAFQLGSICVQEASETINQTSRRKAVFKLTAAVVLKSSESKALIMIKTMMPFIYRVMANPVTDEEFKTLSNEIGELIKEKIGIEEYGKIMMKCSKEATEKKLKRKQEATALKIMDPEADFQAKKMRAEKRTLSRKRKKDLSNPDNIGKRLKRHQAQKTMADADVDFFA